MIREVLGLILSLFIISAMIWACDFEIDNTRFSDSIKTVGGKYQYLTILNLYLQAVYFFLCTINFFFGSNTLILEKRSLVQKIRDFIFAGLAFPIGMFVCTSFWGLYYYDRELIFPEEVDQFLTPAVNHAMHTLPAVAICIESLLHYHRYPSRLIGVSCVITVCVGYAAWVHYLNYINWITFKKDIWVYPVLSQLPAIYRGIFLLGLTLFHIGLYFVGEMYILYLAVLPTGKNELKKKQY